MFSCDCVKITIIIKFNLADPATFVKKILYIFGISSTSVVLYDTPTETRQENKKIKTKFAKNKQYSTTPKN